MREAYEPVLAKYKANERKRKKYTVFHDILNDIAYQEEVMRQAKIEKAKKELALVNAVFEEKLVDCLVVDKVRLRKIIR